MPAASPRLTLQIRTWNIAHGVDVPPREGGYRHVRRKLLREMAELMVEQRPDLILLQEVPVWAGPLLAQETGMGVTLAPAYGAHVPFLHVPLPLAAGAWLGNALPDVVRTQFEGQANAILYAPELLLVSARTVQVNQRRRLRGEPRVAQLARLRHRQAGLEFAVANVHARPGREPRADRAGRLRAGALRAGRADGAGGRPQRRLPLARRARPGQARLDRGVRRGRHRPPLHARLRLEWPATPWLPTRRDLSFNGGPPLRLSDHDPVDAVISC